MQYQVWGDFWMRGTTNTSSYSQKDCGYYFSQDDTSTADTMFQPFCLKFDAYYGMFSLALFVAKYIIWAHVLYK